MAQQINIAIPARFSFVPFRVRWVQCKAEIVGWHETADHSEEVRSLSTMPSGRKAPLGFISQARMLLNREKVTVRLTVPFVEGLEDPEETKGYTHFPKSYEVAVYRDHIPSDIISLNEDRKNTPDISGREFEVLTCPLPGYVRDFRQPHRYALGADAWKMREEFMSLKQRTSALCEFLSTWGLWKYHCGYDLGLPGPKPEFMLVFPNLIWKQRERYLKALLGSPVSWLKTSTPLVFAQTDVIPYFNMSRSYCEDAIEATISIDHLRNLKFRLCKLEDCGKPYQVRTKQQRIYCSIKCAHLANVRKLRARKKAQLRKGAKRNAKG